MKENLNDNKVVHAHESRPAEFFMIQRAVVKDLCKGSEDCAMNWLKTEAGKFDRSWDKIASIPQAMERFNNPSEQNLFIKEVEAMLEEEERAAA